MDYQIYSEALTGYLLEGIKESSSSFRKMKREEYKQKFLKELESTKDKEFTISKVKLSRNDPILLSINKMKNLLK
ncbi:MAG: hypothetical protein ACQEUT_18275 [Bacillota bacterium]